MTHENTYRDDININIDLYIFCVGPIREYQMYADDIVIFFLSPEGLQNKLFSLESYCDDWGMKVNIKKTKVIIQSNLSIATTEGSSEKRSHKTGSR